VSRFEAIANALDLAREGVLLARETVLLMRVGVDVVRERRAAENELLRARVDDLEHRLKACEERCMQLGRSGREAAS
jgi:hypothetical protein